MNLSATFTLMTSGSLKVSSSFCSTETIPPIGYAKISQGGIVGTVIDATIIAKYCVEALATSVILAHNHPSGGLVPSQQDKDITRKIKDTLKIFDCNVLDHIILTEDSFFSFADEGLM